MYRTPSPKNLIALTLIFSISIYIISFNLSLKTILFSNKSLKRFSILTPGCQIPHFDLFDISIKHIVEKNAWINCKEKLPSLITVHNYTLIINHNVLRTYSKHKMFAFCQYTPIYRDKEGEDDNKYRYDYNKTIQFTHHVRIWDEFIYVQCFSKLQKKKKMIYQAYLPFIHKKIQVEKLAQNRFLKHKKLYKVNMNVMLIALDSMSRLNLLRKLPKSYHFIRNVLGGIELMGYNKVADSTFTCMIPMLTGKYLKDLPWDESMSNKPFDKYNIIWKNFSLHGYRTLMAEDPNTNLFPYFISGFHYQPTNYYFNTMHRAIEDSSWITESTENCLGSKLEIEFVLDWLYCFANVFKNKPHFSYTHITKLFHDYIENFGNADKPLLNFLTNLYINNLLNNTVMFIFGDHGLRFGKIRNTIIGRLEERLPAMFIIFPPWFKTKYPLHFTHVQSNAGKLTTPFDIYETMIDILKFDGKIKQVKPLYRGISLFSEIPETRTCGNASIKPHWCTCNVNQHISPNDKIVKMAVNFAIAHINSATLKYRSQCEELTLETIVDAMMSRNNDKLLKYYDDMTVDGENERHFSYKNGFNSVIDYLITFKTRPNNALYECTVRYMEELGTLEINAEISRINAYGTQSYCISNPLLKKYCFCLK